MCERAGGGDFKGTLICFLLCLADSGFIKSVSKRPFLPSLPILNPLFHLSSGLCDVLIELFSLAETQGWDVSDTKACNKEVTAADNSSVPKKQKGFLGALKKRQTGV